MAAAEKKSHKDWFDRKAATALAAQLASADKNFDQKAFVKQSAKGLQALEFNARVKQFADAMANLLPASYPRATAIIRKSFPPPLPDCESVTDGWLQWPVGQFIADYGVPYFDDSMQTMVELTQRFSAEYAVRPFVQQYPDETFTYLLQRVDDDSPHVRRWCSEGSRSRLPWGGNLKSLIEDPTPVLPILESLKDDPELYVRKSVANNLNDIAKDHPELVVDLCKRWSKRSNERRDWIIRHGLRTLIKQGNKGALQLTGYSAPEKISCSMSIEKKRIRIGAAVPMQVTLKNASAKTQHLLVDYVVHYQGKQNNARAKVFKWKSIELLQGESITISKQHAMKPTTVRALYPGKHAIEVQLNGERMARAEFTLTQ